MADSLQKREAEKQQLEEQLRNSQKMEAIGTLAGGVAHDFNNLLTAIMGFGTLLQLKLEEGTSLMSYANQILAAGDRATALTKRLLDFSRKQIINPRPMNLNTIIKNLESMLERIIIEDVEFKVELAEEDLVVMTDPGLIDQVIINLATNGRDAMPDGGMLTVRTKIAELDRASLRAGDNRKPGRYALITVTDTGLGMAEETRKRVFDPFFTTKEVGKGTGLGLSMVYGIVQQHDGFIRVESTPGRGTTFQIYLPLIDSQVEESKPETALLPRGNNETVLVAEDNKLVMALTREILETNGYRIIEAADGEEAVARFMANADKIDMVLLDVIMPKKNGKEVFDEFTKMKPGIKALFMSGYTFDVISRQGVLEEGINLISKPVRPGELLQKMRDILQDRG
jgi:nitrogen-specific signal transduction histidine kinase/ActR/RegA family two-component response regulator